MMIMARQISGYLAQKLSSLDLHHDIIMSLLFSYSHFDFDYPHHDNKLFGSPLATSVLTNFTLYIFTQPSRE